MALQTILLSGFAALVGLACGEARLMIASADLNLRLWLAMACYIAVQAAGARSLLRKRPEAALVVALLSCHAMRNHYFSSCKLSVAGPPTLPKSGRSLLSIGFGTRRCPWIAMVFYLASTIFGCLLACSLHHVAQTQSS